jgi:hypothetical protein
VAAPVCLLMGFLPHFFAPDAARDLVAGYVAALAPGSYVVLSAGRADGGLDCGCQVRPVVRHCALCNPAAHAHPARHGQRTSPAW